MNRKLLEVLIGSLTVVVAFFAWFSVRAAVIVPDSSTWVVPMIFFSSYIILLCLDTMLFRSVLAMELVLIGSLALSLAFAFSWLQLVAILLGGYFLFSASRKIKEDMDRNIKFSPWKSLQVGRSRLLLALAVVICMQYFLTIRNFDGEKKIPRFDAGFITKRIAIPFLSTVNPQFKALTDETLTVDQFILQAQNSSAQGNDFSATEEQMLDAQLPANLTPAQREMIKAQARENFFNTQSQVAQKNQDLVLEIGRKQLSETIGVSVNGDEKISEVFTGLINNKINGYFNSEIGKTEKNSVLPIIFSIVLFLTIYPVGVVLCFFCFLITKLIFSALFKLRIVGIEVVTVSKEILV